VLRVVGLVHANVSKRDHGNRVSNQPDMIGNHTLSTPRLRARLRKQPIGSLASPRPPLHSCPSYVVRSHACSTCSSLGDDFDWDFTSARLDRHGPRTRVCPQQYMAQQGEQELWLRGVGGFETWWKDTGTRREKRTET
jgi:hypothetical protein